MKNKYICFLNGEMYRCGDLSYMSELFNDYVVNSKMYGNNQVGFKVVEKSGTCKDMVVYNKEEIQ